MVDHPYLGAHAAMTGYQGNNTSKAAPSTGRWPSLGMTAHAHQGTHESTCDSRSTRTTGTQTEWQEPPYLASATWGILRDATAELTPTQQARILLAANVVMTNIMDPSTSI